LRPGEKLYEELFHGSEPPADIGHPGLLIATPRASDAAAVGRALDEIAQCCRRGDIGAALAVVDRLVPEFSRDVGVEKESVLS
jgi:FlaA1/EpsC-like NDP-sugar epimerase